MTDAATVVPIDLEQIRKYHRIELDPRSFDRCWRDGEAWPCAASLLADELEHTRQIVAAARVDWRSQFDMWYRSLNREPAEFWLPDPLSFKAGCDSVLARLDAADVKHD